jgi:tetratricopeptide (TPR) repeat protein
MRATLSFAVLLALASSALADAKKEAKAHLARAGEAHKAGRYDEARKELEIAYTLDPQPALLYAIGQVHVMQGQCPQAITFYERFIASNPAPEQAAKASEAIETCKKLQAPVEKPIEPTVDKPVDKPVEAPVVIEKPITIVTTTRPWYTDVVGDVLVGAGLAAGIAGVIFYRGALADRDDADRVTSYDRYDDLLESAGDKQRLSVVFSIAGSALVTAGIISYVVRDRRVETRSISVVPSTQGGLVTWSAQF